MVFDKGDRMGQKLILMTSMNILWVITNVFHFEILIRIRSKNMKRKFEISGKQFDTFQKPQK